MIKAPPWGGGSFLRTADDSRLGCTWLRGDFSATLIQRKAKELRSKKGKQEAQQKELKLGFDHKDKTVKKRKTDSHGW